MSNSPENKISKKMMNKSVILRERDPKLIIHWKRETETPAYMSGNLSAGIVGTPDSAALSFIKNNYSLFRMRKDLKDLKTVKKITSMTGTHIRYQQMFKKTPVYGSTFTVHLDSTNSVQQVENEYIPPGLLRGFSMKPKITKKTAIENAQKDIKVVGNLRGTISCERVILPINNDFKLAWHIQIPATKPFGDWDVFIDANTGKVIQKRDLIKTVNGQGMVFDPNPVVTANNNMLNDSSPNAIVDAQRVTRILRDITETVDAFGNKVTLGDTSIDGPAVAFGNGRVFIAWTGTDSQHRLNVMSSTDGRNFSNKVTLNDTSIAGPALAFFNGRLYLGWTGTDSQHRLNVMSSTDGRNFSNKVTLNDTSSHRPALASGGNTLFLGWTGTDSQHRLNVIQSTNGISWTNKRTLNDTSIDGPSLVYVAGALHIGWTGTDSQHRLNTMFSTDGQNFRGKRTLGDTSPFTPFLTSGNGMIFLAWTGTDSQHRLNTISSSDQLLYSLEGPYCRVVNIHDPATAPVTTNNPNGFNFGRQQDGFEDVMVYYHIDTIQRYIQNWFTNVNNRQIRVDSHDNRLGGFQAYYSPMNKSLGFGDGGPNFPDFAEDADIVLHEYGHAVQDNQVNNWGSSHESGSMGEGFGDILACLFFEEAGGRYNREVLADWAGGAAGLRRVDETKHFPEDMVREVHDDGQIWSGAIWRLFLLLGGSSTNVATRIAARDRVLRTLIESHFLLNENSRFLHGANAYIQANRAIYNANENDIRNVLADNGLLKTTLGETSGSGMAMTQNGITSYIAWTGTDSQKRLNVMRSSNGHQYSNKVTLSETSPHGPALTFGNGRLYLAWTGTDQRHRLNIIQSSNGQNWIDKVTLNDTSIAAPALTFYNGWLYLAWTGTDSRNRLNVMRSNDGRTWRDKVTLNETSYFAPALTNDGTRIFLGWTGKDSRQSLNIISSVDGINYGNKATLSDTSICGPALSVARNRYTGNVNRLFILWTGTNSGRNINVMRATNATGTSFTQKYVLGEWSYLGPTATTRNNHIALGWVGGDNRLNIVA